MTAQSFFSAHRFITWLACVPLLLGLCASPARAQSFNCANARAPQELLICASPTTRRLDSELGIAYAALTSRLSEAARLDVRRAQREWLAYWPTSCRNGRAPLNPRSTQAQECATRAYQDRLTFLRGDTLIAGAIRVYPLNRYKIGPSGGEVEGVFHSTATLDWMLVDLGSVPQNDGVIALASAIDSWLRDSLPSDIERFDDADRQTTLVLRPSLPFLLTAETNSAAEVHGAPRRSFHLTYRHFNLTAGRPMTIPDIFASSGWEQPLATWAARALQETMGSDFPDLTDEDRSTLHADLLNPVRWLFSGDALTITSLDEYDLLRSNSEVSVPWSVVAPWLSEPVRRVVTVTPEPN